MSSPASGSSNTRPRTSRRRSLPRGARQRADQAIATLADLYPGSARELCALKFENPYELLVATILSAQCTDARVNAVTPEFFRHFPDAASLARADPDTVEMLIRTTGFFRSKTRSLIGMAHGVGEHFGGRVPARMEDLVTLPGVGRKTANVIRSVAFDEPGLPVDTHVKRLAGRLKLTTATDPDEIEQDLNAMVPPIERGKLSLRLILHGRQVCRARVPRCEACQMSTFCPSSQNPTLASPPRRIGRP